jgi:hypothetical protein
MHPRGIQDQERPLHAVDDTYQFLELDRHGGRIAVLHDFVITQRTLERQ